CAEARGDALDHLSAHARLADRRRRHLPEPALCQRQQLERGAVRHLGRCGRQLPGDGEPQADPERLQPARPPELSEPVVEPCRDLRGSYLHLDGGDRLLSKGKNNRAFWLRQLHQWHWISSAICLVGMLLFAVTGVTLNHAAEIEARPRVSER